MANSSAVLEDGSTLSRADKLFFKFESGLNLIGGITILALVLLAVTNVLGRWLFNLPVTGYIDWIEQGMAFFAFLGIAYCQRLGGHIRMDIVVGRLRGRTLWVSEFVSTLLMFCITVVLIYGSYLHAWRAFNIGDSSINIDLPTWPAKLIVPIAFTVLAIRLLLQMWAYIRAIKKRENKPVAVPLIGNVIENAAMQAAQEADVLSDKEKNTP